MLPDIIPLPATVPLSATAPALLQYNQSDQAVLDRPVRTNRTNCAHRANIRLCVDGASLELEPSVDENFLRVLVRAVHYAKNANLHYYTGACIVCGTIDFPLSIFFSSQVKTQHLSPVINAQCAAIVKLY